MLDRRSEAEPLAPAWYTTDSDRRSEAEPLGPARYASHILFCSLLLSGCLASQSATVRLQDAVNGMNEEARWGRIDLAQAKVDERYRSTFLTHRKTWHKSFQPADLEVQRIDMQDEGAVSEVVLSGYDTGSMELISATVRQDWKKDSGKFYLVKEEIIEGSKSIFTEMPKPASQQKTPAKPAEAAKSTAAPVEH